MILESGNYSISETRPEYCKNVEQDTPYNTFISSAPLDPSLWFTLQSSLLIRSFASKVNCASSGNFRCVFQFTICGRLRKHNTEYFIKSHLAPPRLKPYIYFHSYFHNSLLANNIFCDECKHTSHHYLTIMSIKNRKSMKWRYSDFPF